VLEPPIDCEWEYTEWSTCSQTCGNGQRQRIGVITRFPNQRGDACPKYIPTETQNCNQHIECNPCVFAWTEWTQCDRSCGQGEQSREQVEVSTPASCPNLLKEYRECNQNPCPRDCKTLWTDWSDCSASCGTGRVMRQEWVFITPAYGGEPCPTPLSSQVNPCELADCSGPIDASCTGRCGSTANGVDTCSCDSSCQGFNDCCPDHYTVCGDRGLGSCDGMCDKQSGSCWCDDDCKQNGDCCADWGAYCGNPTAGGLPSASSDSCQGRCDQQPGPGQCHCDRQCSQNGDCCDDISQICGHNANVGPGWDDRMEEPMQEPSVRSCAGRCGSAPSEDQGTSALSEPVPKTNYPSVAAAASAGVVATNIWKEYRSASNAYNAYATFADDTPTPQPTADTAEQDNGGFGLSRNDFFRRKALEMPTTPEGECWCDPTCVEYGDCCIDYLSLC